MSNKSQTSAGLYGWTLNDTPHSTSNTSSATPLTFSQKQIDSFASHMEAYEKHIREMRIQEAPPRMVINSSAAIRELRGSGRVGGDNYAFYDPSGTQKMRFSMKAGGGWVDELAEHNASEAKFAAEHPELGEVCL